MTIFRLTNEPKTYAWGSLELIPALKLIDSNGQPQAEIWFGSHRLDPSEVDDHIGGNLLEIIGELPYLVKLLAAAKPLSIQAHPSRQRAMEQFAAGAPGYQDGNHKPELIVAVSEFRALCGFRPLLEVAKDINSLANSNEIFSGWLQAFEKDGLKGATKWAFDASQTAVNQLVASKDLLDQDRAQLIAELDSEFPNDNGLLVSVLMNQVTLQPGQALFLPAGNIHSYLSGLGVEVMAASDNVLRGGLTKKAVDLDELMHVLTFEPLLDPLVQTKMLSQVVDNYPVPVEDFSFYRVTPSSDRMLVDLALKGTAILVCVAGEITLSNSLDELIQLAPGEAAFMRAANFFSITGSGTGYLAMG